MEPLSLNQVIAKYERYKEIVEKLESGNWKDDREIAELSIEKVMNIRFIVETIETTGIIKRPHTLPQKKIN